MSENGNAREDANCKEQHAGNDPDRSHCDALNTLSKDESPAYDVEIKCHSATQEPPQGPKQEG